MIPDHFKILIDKLKIKANNKKTVWSKTSRETEFKLNLQNVAIVVDKWVHEGVNYVDITIWNDDGIVIDQLRFSEADAEGFLLLSEIYALASRSYFKVEETFDIIFKELDGDGVIGLKADDELPF